MENNNSSTPTPNYGTPSYNAPNPNSSPPENYLVWAILTTVLCCLPLGIVSIVKSTEVNTKWYRGDQMGAIKSSEDAKKYAIWSAILGPVLGILYLIFVVGISALGSIVN